MGTQIVVTSHPKNESGGYDCKSTRNRLSGRFSFTIAGELTEPGWIVQKVTVACRAGDCEDIKGSVNAFDEDPWKAAEHRCAGAYSWKATVCRLKPIDTFTYYEAWKVNADGKVLTEDIHIPENDGVKIPLGMQPKNKKCGEYVQDGEIKFFYESQGIPNVNGWKKRGLDHLFGKDDLCKTGAGSLWSFDGSNGKVPELWGKDAIFEAKRQYLLKWSCCIGAYKNRGNNFVDVDFSPAPIE